MGVECAERERRAGPQRTFCHTKEFRLGNGEFAEGLIMQVLVFLDPIINPLTKTLSQMANQSQFPFYDESLKGF